MSESSSSSISGTGTFRVPEYQSTATETPAADGKKVVVNGNPLPALPDREQMERFAEALNKRSRSIGRELRFEVDLDRGHAVIQVLDRDTGEIIRQIPPEKITPVWQANGALEVRLYDDVV